MEKSNHDAMIVWSSGKSLLRPGPLYTIRVERVDRGAEKGYRILREFRTRHRKKALEAVNGIVRKYINEGIKIRPPEFGTCSPTKKQGKRSYKRTEWFNDNYQRALFYAMNDSISYREIDSVTPDKGAADTIYTYPLIKEVVEGRSRVREMMKQYGKCEIDEQIKKYKDFAKPYKSINLN